MRCCVPNCKNNSRSISTSQRITFHVFPTEPLQCKAWLKALGKNNQEPRDNSAVCSEHFSCEDLYETESGTRIIRDGAVPLLQVCRVCLVVNVKLFPIKGCELEQEYKNLTGIHLSQHVGFPQQLCAECIQRLLNYSRFRHKSLRANFLLMEIIKMRGELTFNSIQWINRENNQLCSSLSTKHFQPDYYDAYILEIDETKEEINEDNISIKEFNLYSPIIQEEEDEIFISDESSDISVTTDVIKTENYSKTEDDIKTENDSKTEDDIKTENDSKTEDDIKTENDSKTEDDIKTENDTKTYAVSITDDFAQDSNTSDTFNNTTDNTLISVTDLTVEEQKTELLKRRYSSNYKNSFFKCMDCFKGFLDEDAYKSHMTRHTDKYGKYICEVCKIHFKCMKLLSNHIRNCHSKRYSCRSCTFIAATSYAAKLHENYHKGTMYSCTHCGDKFVKLHTYLSHLRIQHPSDFVCELCGYSFISTKGLQMHKKRKHYLDNSVLPKHGPRCMDCNITFLNEGALDVHLKLCTKRKDLTKRIRNDGQNGKKIHRRCKIKYRGVGTKRNCTDSVTCEQCGLELRNFRVYAHHFRMAHPDMGRTKFNWPQVSPIMCEQCGRIFRCRTLLDGHMWIHTGEKPFKCGHCARKFAQKWNLMFHIKVQHSGTPPTCECSVCGKNFYNSKNRDRHMTIHTGRVKSYQCDVCEKYFNTPSEKRTHTEHVHMKKPWPKKKRLRKVKQELEEMVKGD